MQIKVLKTDDLEQVKEIQPEGWYNILPIIEFYTKSSFCFPIKVIIDEKLVGIGSTIIHNDVAWLAHIIVHHEYRNRGIGRLITQHLIDSLNNTICKTIYLIATDMGEPVYKKVGFEVETEYLFFKDLEFKENNYISENILPFSINFKDYIAELDKKVSGEDRFFHFEDHLETGYVYKKDNKIEGFYLPNFGEGLIIADKELAGLELMKLRFKTKNNIAFPINNIFATEFMCKNNFKEFKKAKRMVLGKKRDWEPSKLLF